VPRAGWVKPQSDQRLSDHISIGVLTRVFPPRLVDHVVADAGRVQARNRLLPARVVVYYVLGLALFSQASYEEVMRELTEGLAWASGWARPWNVPTKAALFKARARLGHEPLKALFEAAAQPLAVRETRGAFYRGWRVMSIDGTCLDAADTPANDEAFGRPGSGRGSGKGAYPQVRLVGLAECGTHALTAAAMGPYRAGEATLARDLLPRLGAGMLVLADRYYYSYRLWAAAAGTGAQLCWRTKANHVLPVAERLADGSYLSVVREVRGHHYTGRQMPVRVIEYGVDDGRADEGPLYRLITTIVDPAGAPAPELAALYGQRWEFETALDELKTHQRGPQVVLRSKTPDGVRQEIYGYLCVHYAIRWLMHTVAVEADTDPDRLSFTRTLRAARRTTASHPGFSPSGA
jgi:hypothetical protein